MKSRAGWVGLALALLSLSSERGRAQEPAVVPSGFAIDTTRCAPYRRVYDIVVQTRDSAVIIGRRDVALTPSIYAGQPAWILVESRTGAVPASETLYVSPSIRPLQWNSTIGAARVGVTFVGDTIFGAVSAPTGRQDLIVAAAGRLIVSQTMAEMLMPLLPLDINWTDSARVLAVNVGGGSVVDAEISVIGEEQVHVDSIVSRPMWVVALRTEARSIFMWVDRETSAVHRVQQALPSHVGYLLEYRRRQDTAPTTH